MAIEVFMPGQSRESRETKYRIAETAMGMFLDQGYDSVTVEAVAEASEVSRRTVFRLYRSKDELPFPDHPERLARLEQLLESADQSDDPIEVVIAATEDSLRGFLSRPQIVLARYQLTRVVPELREREIVEHERYIRLTSAFLRSRLPLDSRPFQAPGLAALVDAMHRTALGNWARSGGESDAMSEISEGMAWVRNLVGAMHSPPAPDRLFAVLPDTPATRKSLRALREQSAELE
ncbi:TetR family transcriptional regulator [Dietzia aerolata]|uniref:TetR/AcrR family transcriptional regulator n=1 Tax=Dietzia aerolata TaxID=595984 RepID=A0ABV5JNR9_9ACTN|nr:TetR/AcrR family transcriptional regulator [Dietzia aerolata]MBB0968363.1 TetR family transcriptional regulator [Dietzia aerolata]